MSNIPSTSIQPIRHAAFSVLVHGPQVARVGGRVELGCQYRAIAGSPRVEAYGSDAPPPSIAHHMPDI